MNRILYRFGNAILKLLGWNADAFDPKHPWVSLEPFMGEEEHWELTDYWCNDNASPNVYAICFNDDGSNAWDAVLLMCFPDEPQGVAIPVKKNDAGQAEANFKQEAYFDPKKGVGPYWVKIKGDSDVVRGLGLPMKQHTEYWTVWRKVKGSVAPPEPSVNGMTRQELAGWLKKWAAELEG